MAELADAPDLGSGGATHEGSNPSFRTPSLFNTSGGGTGEGRSQDGRHGPDEGAVLLAEGGRAIAFNVDHAVDAGAVADGSGLTNSLRIRAARSTG